MLIITVVFITATLLSGCAGLQIDSAISKYDAVANQVELGDSKQKVLPILLPTQAELPKRLRKNPDKYIKDGVKIEIFSRSVSRHGRSP